MIEFIATRLLEKTDENKFVNISLPAKFILVKKRNKMIEYVSVDRA